MNYFFHPLAKKELDETIDYYNECQDGLGIEFAREAYKTIQIILQFPKAWPPFSKHTRRCLTNCFPYGIVYQISIVAYIVITFLSDIALCL